MCTYLCHIGCWCSVENIDNTVGKIAFFCKILGIHCKSGLNTFQFSSIVSDECTVICSNNLVCKNSECITDLGYISGNLIDNSVQSYENRKLNEQSNTASCLGNTILCIDSLSLCLHLHHRILIFFTIILLLDGLDLRIDLKWKLGELLLLISKRNHTYIYENGKKYDCYTYIRDSYLIKNKEQSLHYLTEYPNDILEDRSGIRC